MNRLFSRTASPAPAGGAGEGLGRGAWMPPVDIYETDAAIVVTAELPGVDRKAIRLEVRDSTLTLS